MPMTAFSSLSLPKLMISFRNLPLSRISMMFASYSHSVSQSVSTGHLSTSIYNLHSIASLVPDAQKTTIIPDTPILITQPPHPSLPPPILQPITSSPQPTTTHPLPPPSNKKRINNNGPRLPAGRPPNLSVHPLASKTLPHRLPTPSHLSEIGRIRLLLRALRHEFAVGAAGDVRGVRVV